jgi:PRTRC genetic system ThiF family protein
VSYTLRTGWRGSSGVRDDLLYASIVLVGCGGTGGFLAESIARLLRGHHDARLCLVDMDRVGPENLGRQNFTVEDLGGFKAEVLAKRIARQYGLAVDYSVLPYDQALHRQAFEKSSNLALIVGAVDNALARKHIAATLNIGPVLWLDCGNGYASGQVLLGNTLQAKELRNAFDPESDSCYALPAPSLQRPDLFDAPPQPVQDANCAVAVEAGEQSATINQTMAAIAAAYVERLLLGTCTWMATYADMDPMNVGRVIGRSRVQLVERKQAA